MIVPLTYGGQLNRVDTDIFKLRYFAACMDCTFCQDSCCQYGCDVNLFERDKILAHAHLLEKRVGLPASEWFSKDVQKDDDYPSGQFVRSQTRDGRCVFLNRSGRGCHIHAAALEAGIDYHQIKPQVCWMFPITYDRGLLRPNSDVQDDLVCVGNGPTLYESCRGELAVAFGDALVKELDVLARA